MTIVSCTAGKYNLRILKMGQDIGANALEIAVHIGIGISENCQSLLTQILIPGGISLLAGEVIVLRTVKLDNQLLFSDIEINNISTYDFLAMDGERKCFQEVVP